MGARWFQSQTFEPVLNQVRSQGQPLGAVAPAFHGGRGKCFYVIEVSLGLSLRCLRERRHRR